MNRIDKEKQVVDWMIDIWQKKQHGKRAASFSDTGDIDCDALRAYAHKRLENCRFGEDKPTCDSCPIHCYNKEMRAQIRAVMRYSGPRMIFHHPRAAIWHLVKRFKKKDMPSGNATR